MKSIRVLLMLGALVLLLLTSTIATQIQDQINELEDEDDQSSYLDENDSDESDIRDEQGNNNNDKDEEEGEDFEAPTFLRGTGRLLLASHHKHGHRQRKNNTCNKNPRICRAAGSPGRSCCKKKCVNLLTDKRNCGRCGKKCKYSHMCCNGKCVNPRSHEKHCGGCNNNCGSEQTCRYGMCSYADF
ncbi:unnamed protein product [Rhodiola kirilowii]